MVPPTQNLNLDIEAISGICGYVRKHLRLDSDVVEMLTVVFTKLGLYCVLG